MTLKLSARGDIGEIKALFNLLNSASVVNGVKSGLLHTDKSLTTGSQSFELDIQPARYYEPKVYHPRPDRPGVVYLLRGKHTGRFKVGETDNLDRRIGELNREFNDRFQRVHIIQCRDRFAREQYIHQKLTEWGLHVEREFFDMPDPAYEWFVSQPNEY